MQSFTTSSQWYLSPILVVLDEVISKHKRSPGYFACLTGNLLTLFSLLFPKHNFHKAWICLLTWCQMCCSSSCSSFTWVSHLLMIFVDIYSPSSINICLLIRDRYHINSTYRHPSVVLIRQLNVILLPLGQVITMLLTSSLPNFVSLLSSCVVKNKFLLASLQYFTVSTVSVLVLSTCSTSHLILPFLQLWPTTSSCCHI